MRFTDLTRRFPLVTVGKHVEFDETERRWVSTPIRLHTHGKALKAGLERKR